MLSSDGYMPENKRARAISQRNHLSSRTFSPMSLANLLTILNRCHVARRNYKVLLWSVVITFHSSMFAFNILTLLFSRMVSPFSLV